MYGNTNMFSAKRVKLHGMKSSQWTAKDKVTQYKGLIKLYVRDKKIIEVDTNSMQKQLMRKIKAIQKNIERDRFKLDNATKGDRQQVKNLLSEHKEIHVDRIQYCSPQKLTESLFQNNFTERKVLDLLTYKNDMRSKKLMDLKLERALLEDELKTAQQWLLEHEKDAQSITGKVQDAILKREAAMAIKNIYIAIIDLMKKDSLYYESIIKTLEYDTYCQSRCFLNAAKLGQLATEYLDDRKQDYRVLHGFLLEDMTKRQNEIQSLHEKVLNTVASLKSRLRKDSDVTLCVLKQQETPNMISLRQDVTEIEKMLKFLKTVTLVPSFDLIYPSLKQQLEQKKRLNRLLKKYEKAKDRMMNKLDHAMLMNSMLDNTMVETTREYMKQKTENYIEIIEIKKSNQKNKEVLKSRRNLIANVRIVLSQLLQLTKVLKPDPEELKTMSQISETLLGFERKTISKKLTLEEKDEIDALKIIPILIEEFTNLMADFNKRLVETKFTDSYKIFERLMRDRLVERFELDPRNMSEISILEGAFADYHLLTREDIKKESEEIVAAYAIKKIQS